MHVNLIVLLVSGGIGGFIGAQVGAGAVVILPILLFMGLSLPEAVATTAPAGWLMNAVPAVKYWRSGKINLRFVLPISIVAAIGAVAGARLLFIVDIDLLSKLFAVVFCGLGLALLFKPQDQAESAHELSGSRLVLGLILALILGLYGGILAAGLTTIALLVFNVILGQPRLEAVGNSVLFAALLLSTSLVVFIAGHKINYGYAVPLAVSSIVGSYIGARTILRKDVAYFKTLLIVVIVALIAKLLIH